MICDKIGFSCGCDFMRITMTFKTLAGCILGKYRLFDRMIYSGCRMTIMAILDRDIMHCIMAHPALNIKCTVIVNINMGKTRIPIRYLICREFFFLPIKIMAAIAFRYSDYWFFLDRITA